MSEVRYYALLKVEIRQGKELRNADLIGKSDPYAKIHFNEGSSAPEKARTLTIDNNLNPVWNETKYFLVNDAFESFTVTIMDEDVGGDDSLGHCTILRKNHKERYTLSGDWYYLEKGKGGTVEIFTQEVDLSQGIDELLEEKKAAISKSLSGPKEQMMLLQIHVKHAENLKKADWFGKSDPYVIFNFSIDSEGDAVVPQKVKTPTIMKTLNPVWNVKYQFLVPWSLKCFRLDIYDYDNGSSDDLIGKCNLILGENGKVKEGDFAIESKGKIALSYVKVSLSALFSQ